jgi:hypothetical protein
MINFAKKFNIQLLCVVENHKHNTADKLYRHFVLYLQSIKRK